MPQRKRPITVTRSYDTVEELTEAIKAADLLCLPWSADSELTLTLDIAPEPVIEMPHFDAEAFKRDARKGAAFIAALTGQPMAGESRG